jgi:hypothetical protein
VRRVALALAAAIALAGAAEARPVAAPAEADAARAGGAAAAPKRRAADRSQRRRARGRRAKRALRGRAGAVRLGLPPGAGFAPPLPKPAAPGGGGAPDPSGPAGEAPPPPPPPAPPAGSGRSVQARTDDRDPDHLKLILSRTTVLAGDVKVEFNNAFAEDPHDLVVERASASYAFSELQPGDVERRTVALDAGEWRLRCTIPTHAERGMTAALTVTG